MDKKMNKNRDFNNCMLSIYNNGLGKVYIMSLKDGEDIYFSTFEGLDEYLRLHFKDVKNDD